MKVVPLVPLENPLVATKRIKNYIYHPSQLLGAGNFSKVYSGRNEQTGTLIARQVSQWPSKWSS